MFHFLQLSLKRILQQQTSASYAPYARKTQADLHDLFEIQKKKTGVWRLSAVSLMYGQTDRNNKA